MKCPNCGKTDGLNELLEPMNGDAQTIVCFYCDHKLHISEKQPCPYCSYSPLGSNWTLADGVWQCDKCGVQMDVDEMRAWVDSVTESMLDEQDEQNRQ